MAEIFDFGLQQHKIKMDGKHFGNDGLFAVAGDTARRLEVQLLDSNNQVQDTTGLNLRLNAEVKKQVTYVDATPVDLTKGIYQVDLANGMLLAPGNWAFQWQITDADGEKLNSFTFTGNIGKNISEGGNKATNFYLNLEDLKSMQEDFVNGTIESSVLETNITDKLTDLETQYAPKLTEVTAQLAHIAKENVVDLVMFIGQSNMAGRGVASEAPKVPDGAGYEFRAISNPTRLYPIVEPFGKNENNSNGITETNKTGSLVSSFALEYYGYTSIPIVGVSASKGGSSINEWQPDSSFLNDAIERYQTAKNWLVSNGYEIRNEFMVWCQGETDGDRKMPKSEYKEKLSIMIEEMKSQGIETCYIIRIGNHRDNSALYDPIIQAQTELTQTNDHTVLVSTKFDRMATDGLMKDVFHYTQEGYNIVGEDAGKNTAFHINTGREPDMYDWENKKMYFPYVESGFRPYARMAYPFNQVGENALEINSVGTLSNGSISITELNSGKKRLDVPVLISKNKDWTIEVISDSSSNTGSGIILGEGVSTGGFLNIPNARELATNVLQIRDSKRTFNAKADIPQTSIGKTKHQYAVTCESGRIRMFMDYTEYPVIVEGAMLDFYFHFMFGGFDPDDGRSFNFVGNCHYLAITDGKALKPTEMHVE